MAQYQLFSDKAIRAFDEAIRLSSDDTDIKAWSFYYRGGTYISQRKEKEGIRDLVRAIQLKPDYGDALIFLTQYLAPERIDLAIQFQKALQAKPNDPKLYFHLGNIQFHELRRYNIAIALYQESLRLDPKQAEAHLKLGIVYLQLGHKAEAVKVLKECLKLNPANTMALELLKKAELE